MTQTITLAASPKQMHYITDLVDKKDISAELRTEIKEGIATGFISKANATKYLDVLFDKKVPYIKNVADNAVTEEGFYFTKGEVYKVVPNKAGTYLYAKWVTAKGFKYVAGAINQLTADMKMSVEDIQAYGLQTGICVNCAAVLTDPISIAIGLGTQCGPSIMGTEGYSVAKKTAKKDIEAKATMLQSPVQALLAAVEEKKMVTVPGLDIQVPAPIPAACDTCGRKGCTQCN